MVEILNKTNTFLNFIKGLACLGILYMHTCYNFLPSSIIVCLFRFAVLIFFMISGYYCYSDDITQVSKKMPRKIKHISKICLGSTVIYFLFYGIIFPVIQNTNILEHIRNYLTLRSLTDFIVFNQVPFGGVLWFVFALLYSYIMFGVVNRNNWYKFAYIVSVVLIGVHIVSRGIIQHTQVIEESRNIVYYRNFIFMGFPFFMMGNCIHKYEEKIKNKFSNIQLVIMIVVGLCISCVERFIVPLEVYWGTILATFALFVFAIVNPDKKGIRFVEVIGRKYSMYIYILHTIVGAIVYLIKCKMNIQNDVFLQIINPFIVLLILLALIKACEKLAEVFRGRIKNGQ